jgi:AraC-like DNA-binding protein
MADGFPGERLTILPPAVLRRAQALPVCRGLCVTHTWRFDHVHGHSVTRPNGTKEHVLIVCLDGAGRGHLDGAGWSLRGGQGVLLPPGISHDYTADANNPWTLLWFHFIGPWADECAQLVGGTGRTGRHRKFSVHDIELVIEAFEECYRYVLGGYTDADLVGLSTSFVRLLGLCRTLQRPSNRRLRHTEDRVLRTIRFMRENLNRAISLQQLARTASLSISHYSAMFRRQMNCSPVEFLTRLRLQKARERTSDTIAQIGYTVGFSDPLYFSRVFRRHMGVTASEYRHRAGGPNRGTTDKRSR